MVLIDSILYLLTAQFSMLHTQVCSFTIYRYASNMKAEMYELNSSMFKPIWVTADKIMI